MSRYLRDIKFRAKSLVHHNKGKWVYGHYTEGSHSHLIHTREGMTFEIDRDTLSQYTGRNDKKGKEIYEGDICTYLKGIYLIVWSKTAMGFHCAMNPHNGHFLQVDMMERSEVAGNREDNPDLWKWKNF